MFRAATVRLTLLYLGIIAVICLFFSVNLYRLSMRELNSSVSRQENFLRSAPRLRGLVDWNDLRSSRQSQLEEGRQRIIAGLINVNAIFIMLGGVGSYFLARRTIRPIQQAHDAQSNFAADASHALRTPLATMRAEIEVALRDKNLSLAEARELLKSNLEELTKLTSLSEGLLRLTKTDGEEKIWQETVSLGPVIEKAIERVRPLADQKKITVTTHLPNNFTTRGDAVSLVELFFTLIDNAVKYSPDGRPVNITVTGTGKSWEISITDHGLGIGADEIPHIFERFYRAKSSKSNGKVEGYGLGLAVARNIARLHRGDVTARSCPGKGSTFVVVLPKE